MNGNENAERLEYFVLGIRGLQTRAHRYPDKFSQFHGARAFIINPANRLHGKKSEKVEGVRFRQQRCC